MMTLAFVIDTVIKDLGILNIPAQYTILIGLVLGEISKTIHNYLQFRKEIEELSK